MNKPLPRITDVNRPFFDACNSDRFTMQKCTGPDCGKWVFYPRVCCPYCGGGDLEWKVARPEGRIVTYTHVYRPQNQVFNKDVPVPFVAVNMDDGPLVYSELATRPRPDLNLIGKRVRIVFKEHSGGQKLPYFELIEGY